VGHRIVFKPYLAANRTCHTEAPMGRRPPACCRRAPRSARPNRVGLPSRRAKREDFNALVATAAEQRTPALVHHDLARESPLQLDAEMRRAVPPSQGRLADADQPPSLADGLTPKEFP